MTGTRRRIHRPHHAAGGFSMIEVLIALLVLAFGLLGFALLQTLNLRYTQSANYRTEATNLAYDMLDQMRTNRLSALKYTAATFTTGNTALAPPCNREVDTVTPEQSVERWQCQVVEALGDQASATVTYNAGVANVSISWGERVPDGTANPSTTFQVGTRL